MIILACGILEIIGIVIGTILTMLNCLGTINIGLFRSTFPTWVMIAIYSVILLIQLIYFSIQGARYKNDK